MTTCPDCLQGQLDNGFGRRSCPACGTRFLVSVHGIKHIVIPRILPITDDSIFRVKPARQRTLRCMGCLIVTDIVGQAWFWKPGARWRQRGPICQACLTTLGSVVNRDGETVQAVKLIPFEPFHASIHKTPLCIDGDRLEPMEREDRRTGVGMVTNRNPFRLNL